MQEFESIPTDTMWLLEVDGDLENSHDTRRLKNKNRSHEGLFVIFVGFKNTSLAFKYGIQTGVFWYTSFECFKML